jgi:hypothetical protein
MGQQTALLLDSFMVTFYFNQACKSKKQNAEQSRTQSHTLYQMFLSLPS